jgi:fatty acid desaturase
MSSWSIRCGPRTGCKREWKKSGTKSGNLSHQIEHHLFPDLPSNRYPELAPRVQALAGRYGLPYNTGSLSRQFGTTLWNILRLSLPVRA